MDNPKYSIEGKTTMILNGKKDTTGELRMSFKTQETVFMPTDKNQPFATLKIIVWVIIAVVIIGSFILGDNLFFEFSWPTRIMLIVLAIGLGFWKPKKQPIGSPLEIQFYDDYLIVFRNKRYYSNNVTRKEYNKFFYFDISNLEYDYQNKRLSLIGKIDAMWYNYNKDGSVPQNPTYHRIIDCGICYFYVNGNDADTILTYLEKYTSKQPVLKNKTEMPQ